VSSPAHSGLGSAVAAAVQAEAPVSGRVEGYEQLCMSLGWLAAVVLFSGCDQGAFLHMGWWGRLV
jgi:hypothetical protein